MGKQTFLTSEKGRVIDLCTAYMQQESLLLRTSPSNSQNVRKWIEKFIISEDVMSKMSLLDFSDVSGGRTICGELPQTDRPFQS